jgi:hypothetical protein
MLSTPFPVDVDAFDRGGRGALRDLRSARRRAGSERCR